MKSVFSRGVRVLALSLGALALAGCATYGDGYGDGYGDPGYGSYGYAGTPPPAPAAPQEDVSYVDAPVVSAVPVYRQVQVAQPRQSCQQVPADNTANSLGGTVLGGLVGGVVGHAFGAGSGNTLATAAGAVTGAVVGNNLANRGAPQYVTRCQTVNDYVTQRQADGYDVTYSYNGQNYHTHSAYRPGSTIRVRVAVSPSGG
jgi:Predicted outer membrane lipoprotein